MKKLSIKAAILIFALGFGTSEGVTALEAKGVLMSIFPKSLDMSFNNLKSLDPSSNEQNNFIALKADDIKEQTVCFTPPSGCAGRIARTIARANESIFVQAYGFSHPLIAEALIKAKQRGVEVKVLLDRSNLSQNYSKMKELQKAGIEVKIDKVSGIAHNKVMILDKKIVITGSFNFTKNADNNNAENVLILESKEIAQRYLSNWFLRASGARENKSAHK